MQKPAPRIAFVCTGFPIPTETFVISQAVGLLKAGFEVDIFPYKQWPAIPGDFETYKLANRIYPTFIPPRFYGKRLLIAVKLFCTNIRYGFKLIKTLNPLILGRSAVDLTVFYSAIAFLHKAPYDIVMAHFGENGIGMEKLIRCGFSKASLISFFYGYDIYTLPKTSTGEARYADLFKVTQYAVGVSRHMCNRIRELGCKEEKIVYCPCPPNDKFFALPLDFSGNFMLAVGRFVEKKAPQLTIQAFAMLQKLEPDASLVMVGDGPLLESCERLVKSLGLRNVFFKGTLLHYETEVLFKEAICFLQHSVKAAKGDSEGTPVGILEAGAAGLPVVSTRHGGIPDVVLEQQTGFLVEEGDVEGMAEAMLSLYRDRVLCRQMGMASRARVFNHFRMERYMETIKNMISKANG